MYLLFINIAAINIKAACLHVGEQTANACFLSFNLIQLLLWLKAS